jgi:L-amino acid N-acyltransferase YncA
MNFSKVLPGDRIIYSEKTGIRRIRVNDVEEMRRMRIIEDDPEVCKFVEDLQATEEGLRNFAKGSSESVVLGVIQGGEVQGWICLYPDESERLTRLGLAEDAVEICYAKYPGAPRGLMSSGLRQVIEMIVGETFTAYTDPDNLNSSRLLEAVGFKNAGKIKYHPGAKTLDNFWILNNSPLIC